MIIREMTERDFAYIASAHDKGFKEGFNENVLRNSYSSGRFFGFIAEENSPVGFINFSLGFDDADIDSLFVESEERKKGIAKELIVKAEEFILTQNKKKIFLEVKDKNIPAINLYKKMGYVPFFVRKKYYPDGSDAIVMKKEI